MPSSPQNPNLRRHPVPGLLAWAFAPLLNPLLFFLRAKPNGDAPVVFESYMVGDFFMALPALKILKKSASGGAIRVLCRRDCLGLLAREGIQGIPFENPFRIRPGFSSFAATWRSAWALRGQLGAEALDLDGDPRTAFWLKVAGVRAAVSYRRAFGVLFDETFALPEPSVHQADRDMRVVEEWLKRKVGRWPLVVGGEYQTQVQTPFESEATPSFDRSSPYLPSTNHQPPTSVPAPWLLSVWTRKASKNWPLPRWGSLLEKLSAAGVPFAVLEPPDGDAAFRDFHKRWNGRVEFLRGSLTEIDDAVRACAGVIATDNFLGHMAGYRGKPVLWINVSSPAEQVEPRGPRTVAARGEDVEGVWRTFEELRGSLDG